MLRRPLVVLVVIGTAVPIMAVQRITATVLAASMVSFSFAVAIQLAVGAAVVASAGSRRVSFPRALDLWFAGHVDGVRPAGRADAHPAWRRLSVALSWLGALGLVVLPTPRTPRTPRTIRTP